MNVSMCDVVAESDAYQKAYDKQIITKEMLTEANQLAKSLAQLCLANQIQTFNEMITKINAARKVATQPETPKENTNA